jgi:hypothetical protein
MAGKESTGIGLPRDGAGIFKNISASSTIKYSSNLIIYKYLWYNKFMVDRYEKSSERSFLFDVVAGAFLLGLLGIAVT